MRFETKAIRLGHEPDPKTRAVIPPIHLGVTYQFNEVGIEPEFDYSRANNPTRALLERTLAGLENTRFGVCFASGMAATDGILSPLLPGDEVVAARNIYGGTWRLFESVYRPRGVNIVYVDGDDPADWKKAITGKTRMLWLETPTNPQLQIFDISAFAAIAHEAGLPLVVDNTFASPYFQRPAEFGADIVLQSTTKFLSGHHDVMGGAVMTNSEEWYEKLRFYQNTAGGVPSSFDCYLIQRGLKTLALRMRQHNETAQAVAEFLSDHPAVEKTLYPGLPDSPGHELAKRQMSGFGGMVTAFLKGTERDVKNFTERLRIFHFAESLGGAESLMCHPTTMSHAVLTEEERRAAGITYQMIRASVGLEHPEDLMEDLRQALQNN